METTEFIYVGDVMCSWCWGFAPTVEALSEHFTIPVRVVNGGLRPGPDAQKLDDDMKAYLTRAWTMVGQRSGQPFDAAFLDRNDGWVYDTELPAIAVATMRELHPERTKPFFLRLQRAFYAEATDITDPEVYPSLLEDADVEVAPFLARMMTDEMKWRAWEDFDEARGYGASGFPTLLLRLDGRLATVARGYAPADQLIPAVQSYLRGQLGDAADGLVCDVDGNC